VDEKDGFVFPSYVEDILGPELFDYGYGPFRWVCLSGKHEDLIKTDKAAMDCIDPNRRGQDRDNWLWIRDAEKNQLVVGTQARILYQDAEGRTKIALKFNEMVRKGEIGPVMMGRDHHDTAGADSPFRETSNVKDGSNMMADMATQCFAGNAATGHVVRYAAQWRWRGSGQGDKRRLWARSGRLGAGGRDYTQGHALGRDGRRCAKVLGAQSSLHGSLY